jgi:hypothetical protein
VNAKRVNTAAAVILAALTQNRTAAGIATALESSGHLATPAPAKVFRASHDSIVMGYYTTADSAREHCEAMVQQEEPAGSIRHMSWSADDIGDHAEYELHITPAATGELIRGTGYLVTPLEIASEYDPDADQ